MQSISSQKCFNHPLREAAARCLECGRFFCRECITEHEDKVLCASCLAKRIKPETGKRRPLTFFYRIFQTTVGVWAAWIFFYYIGKLLMTIPASFHEGTYWSEPFF